MNTLLVNEKWFVCEPWPMAFLFCTLLVQVIYSFIFPLLGLNPFREYLVPLPPCPFFFSVGPHFFLLEEQHGCLHYITLFIL